MSPWGKNSLLPETSKTISASRSEKKHVDNAMHEWTLFRKLVLTALLLFLARQVLMPAEAPDTVGAELKILAEALHLTEPQKGWAGPVFQMIKAERDSRQRRFMIRH